MCNVFRLPVFPKRTETVWTYDKSKGERGDVNPLIFATHRSKSGD